MTNISIEWVDSVPEPKRHSPYEAVAARVRETGEIARIEVTKGAMYTLTNRLRTRYPDLAISARTLEDGFYVFVSRKETKKGK